MLPPPIKAIFKVFINLTPSFPLSFEGEGEESG